MSRTARGAISIRIEAGGRARFPFELSTVQRRSDASCDEVVVGPLAAGRYTVELRALFLRDALEIPLVVERAAQSIR